MQVASVLLAAAAAACTVAQAGPNGGSGGKTKSTATKAKAKAKVAAGCAAQDVHDPWPYLDAPADPWRAVVDGKPAPAALPTKAGGIPEGSAHCDAAHDHCLRDCTWLMTQPNTSNNGRIGDAFHFSTDGTWISAGGRGDTHPQPGFIAYRTVPVTRKNLAVGAFVFAIQAPAKDAGGHGTSDALDFAPLDALWDTGVVESIDWDAGLLRMKDRKEAYFLSATRVAVLKFVDGADQVEAIDGVDATAPAVADVILPTARKQVTSDPWSQVGKNKQPIAVTTAAVLTDFAESCTPANDHCLAPWAWFVDTGGLKMQPARWTGAQFTRAADPDSPLDSFKLAYRTRPAKESEVKVGAELLIYDAGGPPPSQREAHMWTHWIVDKVATVDAKARTFELADGARRYPMSNARVLVLYWLPGEDAGAVE